MLLKFVQLNIAVSYEIGITEILIFFALIAFVLFKLRDKRLKKQKTS